MPFEFKKSNDRNEVFDLDMSLGRTGVVLLLLNLLQCFLLALCLQVLVLEKEAPTTPVLLIACRYGPVCI